MAVDQSLGRVAKRSRELLPACSGTGHRWRPNHLSGGRYRRTYGWDSVEPHIDSLPGQRVEQWVAYHHQFAVPSTPAYEFVWNRTEAAIGPFCTDTDGDVLAAMQGALTIDGIEEATAEVQTRSDPTEGS